MQSNVTSQLHLSSYKSRHIHHFERQRGLRGCRIRRPRELHVCDTAISPLRFKLNICPMKICSQAARGADLCLPWHHTQTHISALHFDSHKTRNPLVCRTVRIQYRSQAQMTLTDLRKQTKSTQGDTEAKTDTKKDFIFWKPSGHLEIWNLQALWLSMKDSGSRRCAPDKQIVENRRLFTPPIIFAC